MIVKVTVGVASFNENYNISKLLQSLRTQRASRAARIVQIIVSDDSDDTTPLIVSAHAKKDRRIRLYHHQTRRGKPAAVNEIFAKARGDVVVLFDADVLPKDDGVVLRLIEPMLRGREVGICGGAACAVRPRYVMERLAHFTYNVWQVFRRDLRGGSNFFAIHGKIMAVSGLVAERVRLPESIIGDDGYLYLRCLQLGKKAQFVPDAVVYYQETTTLHDFLIRRLKYEHNLNQLIAVFGDLAKEELAIPRSQLLRVSLREGFRDPAGIFLTVPLVVWSKLKARVTEGSSIWAIASSTKQVDPRKIPT
jgi:glycosyltransferase involved in cell wall biosynthesis